MKYFILLITLFIHSLLLAQKAITFHQTFTGEDIYISNPFVSKDSNCIDSIKVNDKTLIISNITAFAIDPEEFGIQLDEKFTLIIYHKENCLPKILNSGLDNYKTNFELSEFYIDSNKTLQWITTNEKFKLTYYIEQYRWNKWITIGEVEGKGKSTNNYSFKPEFHSGINLFRIKQQYQFGRTQTSNKISYTDNSIEEVEMINTPDKTIEFSSNTFYEVFDEDGNLIYKGYGKEIHLEKAKIGLYYINYDNKIGVPLKLRNTTY